MSAAQAFAELVREHDSPHVSPRMSRTFDAVLAALAAFDQDGHRPYIAELAGRSEVERGGVSRILVRMYRYGLVDRADEPGTQASLQRAPRRYYWLTPTGVALARSVT